MRCFVCKKEQAEAMFWGIGCCLRDYETLHDAERKAVQQGISLTEYIKAHETEFTPETIALTRFLD
ncbi:MAG: hypothetical protein HY675_27530 [Chloroflexi bacterium]|nr:hypothetical protein [Chloroflexota bacterium]